MRRREYLFRRIWRIVSFHLTWLDVRAGREYSQRKESKFMLNKYVNADILPCLSSTFILKISFLIPILLTQGLQYYLSAKRCLATLIEKWIPYYIIDPCYIIDCISVGSFLTLLLFNIFPCEITHFIWLIAKLSIMKHLAFFWKSRN